MSIYLGNTEIGQIYLGSTEIGEAYLGSTKVFEAGGGGGGGLPSGYTQLEYVSNAVRSIDTGVTAAGSKWEFDLVCDSISTNNRVFTCSNSAGGHFAGALNNNRWGLGGSAGMYVNVATTTRSTIIVEYTTNGMVLKIGNLTASRTGSSNHSGNALLFGDGDNNYLYNGRLYSAKCTSGGNFNGIPAKRDSDNHVGLYDMENNVFHDIS